MHGTIVVSESGVVTTTTSSPPPATTTTGAGTTPLPAGGSPLAGSAAQALKLLRSQRGAVVKGTVGISAAGAGDRLEVDVFATNASLTKGARGGRTRVGRFVRGSVQAGTTSFVVKLDAKARRALKRHRHLSLTVRITLSPLYGEPLTITRSVLERD